MTIRPYTSSDRPRILAGLFDLQKQEHEMSDTRMASTVDLAERYLAKLHSKVENQEGAIFVAEVNGEVTGFLVCLINRGDALNNMNETADFTTYGYISDAYVFPEFRKQGLFSALEAAAIQHLKQFPEIKRLMLYVLAANTGAIAAYEKKGFEPVELILQKRVQ